MNSLALTSAAPGARQRRWPWVLGGLAVLSLLAVLAAASALGWVMDQGGPGADFLDGMHIVVNGDEWHRDGPGTVLAVVAGLLAGGAALVVGLLVVVAVVPLAVALALAGVALGIAAAVFSVLAVAAAVLLPLWLPLLLLWLLLRRKPAARMAA